MNIIGIVGQTGSGKDTVADHLCLTHGAAKISMADPIKRFGHHVFGFDDVQLWGPSYARNSWDPRYKHCEIRSSGLTINPQGSLSAVKRVCDIGWFRAVKALVSYGPNWLSAVLPGCDVDKELEVLCYWVATLGHKYPELSPRIMLQHLGTEWGRQVAGEDIWISLFLSEAKTLLTEHVGYHRTQGTFSLEPDEVASRPSVVVCPDVRFKNEITRIKAAGGHVIRVLRPSTDSKAIKTGIGSHVSETEQQGLNPGDFDVILQNKGSLEDLYESVDLAASTLLKERLAR